MAVMDALLRIKASVTGEEGLTRMAAGLGGLNKSAENASKGLKGMLASAGGLSGALGSLVPLATGAGLAAMAKSAIDAADDMNDLSQKTGVSVEQLSKFQQAANASGTSIEGVSGAMIKLSKSLAGDLAGPAGKALKELGLNATDANGKLKNTDQIMLEVADKFKALPDGAKKTALAIQLFGKAGADMIPLLNGGRDSVEKLSATMSTKFAKSADNVNDKIATLQGKLTQLAVKLGEALLPSLEKLSDVVLGAADGFSKLPGWVQGLTGAFIGLMVVLPTVVSTISGLIGIAKVLSAFQLGATIAAWAGAIGPAMAVISAAFTGLLTFLTGTVLPALLAFFSGPVGWTVLAVAAVVAMAIAFRKPLGDFIKWLGGVFKKGWDGFVENILKKPLTAYFTWWRKNWDIAKDIVGKVFSGLVNLIKKPMEAIATMIRNTLRLVFRNLENAFNAFVVKYNNLVANIRKSGFGGLLGLLPTIPLLNLPKFAQGGIVTKPTIAMVGEGGESEAIIPLSKLKSLLGMGVFSSTGAQIQSMSADLAEQLLKQISIKPIPSTPTSAAGSSQIDLAAGALAEFPSWLQEQTMKQYNGLLASTAKAVENAEVKVGILQLADPSITVTTGPILQFNGQNYVTVDDLQNALRSTTKLILNSLRDPSTRLSLGIG